MVELLKIIIVSFLYHKDTNRKVVLYGRNNGELYFTLIFPLWVWLKYPVGADPAPTIFRQCKCLKTICYNSKEDELLFITLKHTERGKTRIAL